MANSKVIIRINQKHGQGIIKQDVVEKELVFNWDIKKILIFIALLLLVILIPIYLFSVDSYWGENSDELEDDIKIEKPSLQVKPPVKIYQDLGGNKSVKFDESIDSKVNLEAERQNTQITEKDITVGKEKEILNINNNLEKISINEGEKKKHQVIRNDTNNNPLLADIVSRSVLTLNVVNKEPTDDIGESIVVPKESVGKVFYFTEIINMSGKALFHRWEWNGQLEFEKKLFISSNKWRAATSKKISPKKPGIWKVSLIDDIGREVDYKQVKVIVK